MPEIETVRPPRNGPINRQRRSWYIAGSYGWAERAKGKSKMQSAASRIQKKRLFTVGPRKRGKDKPRQRGLDRALGIAQWVSFRVARDSETFTMVSGMPRFAT